MIGDDEVKWQPSDDNQITLTRLSRYSGAQFDSEYVKALVKAHETDIGVAQDAREFSSSPAVKRYLQQTLSVDRKHLRTAHRCNRKYKIATVHSAPSDALLAQLHNACARYIE